MATQGTVAFEGNLRIIPGLTSSANLTAAAAQFTCVNMSGSYTVNQITSGLPIGILQNKPNTNQAAEVAGVGSITKALAGGTITAGQTLGPTTGGAVIHASSGATMLYALEGASSGDYVTVLVAPGTGA